MKLKMLIIFTIVYLNIFVYSFSELSMENKYIALCKAIYEIEEVSDSVFLAKQGDKKHIFFLSNTDYISDPDKRIDLPLKNNIILSVWFKKDLFFKNIPYWFEIKIISDTEKNIELELTSYNSINVHEKKPILKGQLTFEYHNNQYRLVKKDLKTFSD